MAANVDLLEAMNVEELGEWIAEQAAHLDAATHRLLTAVREFDASGGWYKQGARSCAEWLAWRVGWSQQTARDRVRVAQRLGELPLVDDELRRGALSYCKVRAITRVATHANEAALVELARYSTGAQLERICRKYAAVQRQGTDPDPRYDDEQRYLSRRDLDNGFVELRARLHPEEAAAVWAALDRIVKERAHARPTVEVSEETTSCGATVPDAASESVFGSASPGLELSAPESVSASDSASESASAPETASASATAFASAPASEPASVSPSASLSALASTSASAKASELAPGAMPRTASARGAFRAFRRVDALVMLAEEVLRGVRPERSPVELVVTVEIETLRDPVGAVDPIGSIADGTCLSAETVRRLGCDCGVVQLTEDEHGRAVSVGRKTRSIPASIKRALLRRDRTCRFPGCENRMFVEGHHIEHWADGGETSLSNLVGLCSHHHRYVHEYGHRIELDEEQQPRVFDPRGRLVVDVPPPPASAYRGWELVTDRNRELAITAETPACGWDGQPVDYEWVIDALLSVERSAVEQAIG